MRIAMLTNNYKPYVGGVPISIEHLAEELRKRGHTVYIFAPSYRKQEDELYVIRYPSFPLSVEGAPLPNILTGLFRQKMKELQIDLIHVHHPAIAGNVALTLRRQLGIPVVFTYHTRYEEYLYYVKSLQQVERCTGVINSYLRYFCNHCDLLLAPTPGIEEHLEKKCLELGLEKEVIFLGNVDNRQIKNYQAACDLFLFTSKSETQGIVLLEAMAAGTPVVAVDATGVRDVVRTKENGMLSTEDADSFAAAIECALRRITGEN